MKGILERLAEGPVIGDGGFVVELERRGYVRAGPWTPEATVENPDAGRSHSYLVAEVFFFFSIICSVAPLSSCFSFFFFLRIYPLALNLLYLFLQNA